MIQARVSQGHDTINGDVDGLNCADARRVPLVQAAGSDFGRRKPAGGETSGLTGAASVSEADQMLDTFFFFYFRAGFVVDGLAATALLPSVIVLRRPSALTLG